MLRLYYAQNISKNSGTNTLSDESFPVSAKEIHEYHPKNKDLHLNFHWNEIQKQLSNIWAISL